MPNGDNYTNYKSITGPYQASITYASIINLGSRCPFRSSSCYPDTIRSSMFDHRRVWSRYGKPRRPACRRPSGRYSALRTSTPATSNNI